MANWQVRNWREAAQQITTIAQGLPVFYGTGYPIERPHVNAVSLMDYLPRGYFVTVFPHGERLNCPSEHHYVFVTG